MKPKAYSNEDFPFAKLPSTRGQQYLSFLKNEKLTLLYLGLLLLLFALPSLAVNALRGAYVSSLANMVSSQDISKEAARMNLFVEDCFFGFLMLLAYLILGAGIAGEMGIYRNLSYEKGILFWSDFGHGIKKNVAPMLWISSLLALLRFLLRLLLDLASVLDNDYFLIGVGAFLALTLLLAIPLLLWWGSETACFDNKTTSNLSNLFPLLGYGYGASVLFALGVILCPGVSLLGDSPWIYLAYVALSLLSPYYLLGWQSYSLSVFDKTLSVSYPQWRYKGLHRPIGRGEE